MNNDNALFTELIHQWQKKNIAAEPEELYSFLQNQEHLSPDGKAKLAILLIADDFRRQRSQGMFIWVEKQKELYLPLFNERGFRLDEHRLTCDLIMADMETTQHRLYRSDFIARFPDCHNFIDHFFEFDKTLIESRFRRIDEEIKKSSAPAYHKNGEKLSLSEDYEVLKRLGSGGQKDIYEVKQESTSQLLALKELRSRNSESALQREAMLSEASLQAKLSHPNIPMVLSLSGGDNAPPIFVERLISGQNWLNIIDQQSLEENLNILITISRTLAFVHEKHRIIHGDLKPDNVMLGEMGGKFNEIYLVDWGLAVSLDSANLEEITLGGTIPYMPSEALIKSNKLSPATDVFMLGAIAYRILVGIAPYEEVYYTDRENAGRKVIAADFAPIPKIDARTGKKIPEELIEIVNKALSKEPEDRYADAGKFADALARFQKRFGLSERLDSAAAALDRLQNGAAVPSMMALIENTNELRLIRETAVESDAEGISAAEDQASLSSLSRRALQSEAEARNLLLEVSLSSKDYGLADAQIPITNEHLEILRKTDLRELSVDQQKKLDDFKERLRRGLAARRRERILKGILAAAACLIVGLVCLAFYQKSQSERQTAQIAIQDKQIAEEQAARVVEQEKSARVIAEEQAARTVAEQEKNVAKASALTQNVQLSESEQYGQGALTYLNQMGQVLPNDGEILARLEDVMTRYLLPEQKSGFREITDAMTFSSDGSSLVTFSPGGILSLWSTEELTTKVRTLLYRPEPYQLYAETNPLFGNDKAADFIKNSPFILYGTHGAIKFLADDLTVLKQYSVIDLNKLPKDALDITARSVVYRTGGEDAPRMAAIGKEGMVYLFSLGDGRLLHSFQAQESGLKTIVVSEDAQRLVTLGSDGSIQYRTIAGELLQTFEFDFPVTPDPNNGYIRRCALSPSGNRIAAGSESGAMVIWDIPGNKPIAEMTEPDIPGTIENYICRFYWLDEDHVLSLCLNNHYCLWDLTQIDEKLVPASIVMQSDQPEILSGPSAAAFSRVKKLLFVAGNDHTLRLFDVESGKQLAQTEGLVKSSASCFTVPDAKYFGPADRLLVGNFAYQSLVSINPETLRTDKIYEPYSDLIYNEIFTLLNLPSSIAVPETGAEFVAAFCSGDLMIFDVADSKPKHIFSKVFKPLTRLGENEAIIVAASPSGKYFAATSLLTDEIILFDWKERREIRRFEKNAEEDHSDKSTAKTAAMKQKSIGMAFIDDAALAEWTIGGRLKIWNVESGALKDSASFGKKEDDKLNLSMLSHCELSHDKSRAALGFADGYFVLVDLEDLSVIYTADSLALPISLYKGVNNDKEYITGFSWSKDDSILAVSLSSGKTALTELKYKTVLTALTSNENEGFPEFSPYTIPFFTKNDKFITLDSNGVMTRWDFKPSAEKASVLKTAYGADALCSLTTSGQWAGVRDTPMRQNAFFVYDGDQERYTVEQIEDFQRFEPNAESSYFILLNKGGILSVVNQSDGKSVDYPIITAAEKAPKSGFLRIVLTPDRRFLAALEKNGDAVYLLDLNETKPVWKKIFDKEAPPFVQIAVSTDSKILTIADDLGVLRVFDLETRTERFHPDRVKLQGPIVARNQGRIRFLSDRLLAQSGPTNTVSIWDLQKIKLVQKVKLNLIDRIVTENNSVNGIALLPDGIGKRKELAFVVAGIDGILRFFQYQEDENKFVLVYIVSPLELASLIGEPYKKAEPYLGYNALKNFAESDVSEEKMKKDMEDLIAIMGEDEGKEMLADIDGSSGTNGKSRSVDSGPIIRPLRCWVFDLALSDDGQTLYVGTSEEVRSYDMNEINRNIETLSEKWRTADLPALTGLICRPDEEGLFPYMRNFMQKEPQKR